ncbi:hypothetical protein BKA64DRAFT_648594 [Cadophora sp. MPI-SDFR-AT-0126]|nr:hypothetical protein BKA64DRAFT_648594 [Leotiomycetes sp. MPI-SDFR-AT-0126]
MVFPFGVSVGDFIAGITLLYEALKALDDVKGARSDHEELSAVLESLQVALTPIENLPLYPSTAAQAQAIQAAVERCRQCINRFLVRIDKFRVLKRTVQPQPQRFLPSLEVAVRKLQWSLCRKEDVARFKATISGHVGAVQLLLLTLQMYERNIYIISHLVNLLFRVDAPQRQEDIKRAVEAAESDIVDHIDLKLDRHLLIVTETRNLVVEQRRSLDSIQTHARATSELSKNIHNLQQSIKRSGSGISLDEQQLLIQTLSQMRGQNRELLNQFSSLVKQVVQVKDTIKLQRHPPPQVLLQKPVILYDALGRISHFHLDFIDSFTAFMAVLRIRFETVGLKKIEREEFRLEEVARRRTINLKLPWKDVFRPGQQVEMSMIFERENMPQSRCPGCNVISETECFVKSVTCISCGMVYKMALPGAHEKLERPAASVPYPTEKQDDDVDIRAFVRVQIITILTINWGHVAYQQAQTDLGAEITPEMMEETLNAHVNSLKVSAGSEHLMPIVSDLIETAALTIKALGDALKDSSFVGAEKQSKELCEI